MSGHRVYRYGYCTTRSRPRSRSFSYYVKSLTGPCTYVALLETSSDCYSCRILPLFTRMKLMSDVVKHTDLSAEEAVDQRVYEKDPSFEITLGGYAAPLVTW